MVVASCQPYFEMVPPTGATQQQQEFNSNWYVTKNGSGVKNGSDWNNAISFKEFLTMMSSPNVSLGDCGIHIQEGEYTIEPEKGYLPVTVDILCIRGGYSKDLQYDDLSKCDPALYPTVFTGPEGFIHVTNGNVRFDNITFRGFKQTDSMDEELAGLGSAVIGINGPFTTTAVECRNCIFQDNSSPVAGTASHEGGSCAFIKEGYLKLKNCKFLGNSANSRGGAIRAIGKTSVIFMDNCFFSGNTITGQWGSAVQLSDGVVCANNCTFVDNVGAGCPVNGGGAFFLSSNTIIENRPANGTNDAAFRCESKADRGSTLINNLIINLNPEGSALILNSSGTYKSLGYNVIGTVALGSGCNDPIVTLDYKAESVIDGELDGYCWKWDITQIQENLKGYAVADEVYDAAIGFDPSAYCGISVVGRAFATWVTPNAFAYDCRGNVRGDDGFQPGSYDPNLD